jgi:hypothetical protein
MNRIIVKPGQIPLDVDPLQTERFAHVGLGRFMAAVMGLDSVVVDGLAVTQTSPASMQVNVSAGCILIKASVDATDYGSLTADTRQIMRLGELAADTLLTLTAPGVFGQSINYLIQVTFSEADDTPLVRSYYNAADPSAPLSGPAGAGTTDYTVRRAAAVVNAKAGASAATGSQTTPTADAGYYPLAVVTVSYGATTITSVNISAIGAYPQSPYLLSTLPDVPKNVQSGVWQFAQDTGTANALAVALTPIPTAYTAGMILLIKKSAAGNTGNVTINVNGIGVASVLDPTGAQIGSGNMPANSVMLLGCDGTGFRFMNGSITQTTISSITATSGEGITVGGTTPFPVALNFPGLSADSPTALDLFAFYDNEGAHHKNIQWQNLVPLIGAGLVTGLINVQLITASGTYTKTTGARRALVFATGGGGGGGGSGPGGTGGGGGAGGTAIAFSDLTGVSTVTCTIGAGGAGNSGANGASGGATSFGSLAVATGGVGGQGNSSEVPIQRFQT